MRHWDDEAFIAHLPDLRQVFTQLRPQETAELANRIVGLQGANQGESLLQMHYETTELDLHACVQLEQTLAACLRRDGLEV